MASDTMYANLRRINEGTNLGKRLRFEFLQLFDRHLPSILNPITCLYAGSFVNFYSHNFFNQLRTHGT
jgi:hypothetical protein